MVMKKRDVELLEKLHQVIGEIPLPAYGSQSTTAEGYVAYALDMQEVAPWIRKAIQGIALQDRSGWQKGVDYDDPASTLCALSRWVAARKAADWRLPVPTIEQFADAATR
jgi:hypothetical protein